MAPDKNIYYTDGPEYYVTPDGGVSKKLLTQTYLYNNVMVEIPMVYFTSHV